MVAVLAPLVDPTYLISSFLFFFFLLAFDVENKTGGYKNHSN